MMTKQPNLNSNTYYLISAYTLVLILFLVSCQNGFFWDTVQLGSRHAHFYLNSDFSELLLPNNIDSGHIPAFGMYLAIIWKYIGKTIFISHLAILPFIIGTVWQLFILVKKFVPQQFAGPALLLILLESALLTQMTLISPDVLLVFFFLCALNLIIENKVRWLPLIIVLLFLTSMRGMMISFCLLIFDIFLNIPFTKNYKQTFYAFFKRSFIYLPALLVFIAFSWIHYQEKGWIGYHKDSPWAESFERVDFLGFIRNIAVLGYRFIELGKIGIWVVLIFLMIRNKKFYLNKTTQKLVLLCLLFTIIFPFNMLWAKGLLNPRYLIPTYLSYSLLTIHLLFSLDLPKIQRQLLASVWIILFFMGTLNIFPHKQNIGWDSALAHLPYYNLRHQAIKYLDDKKIPLQQVGSFFPNIATLEIVDLNGNDSGFTDFTSRNKYIFISNVFNLDEEVLKEVNDNYHLIKTFKSKNINIFICEKNN